jgi:hypothetical protein
MAKKAKKKSAVGKFMAKAKKMVMPKKKKAKKKAKKAKK